MLINLIGAKRRLRYENVIERLHQNEYLIFEALLDDESLPSVQIWFDKRVEFVQFVSFSYWHGHYERWGDEKRNVIEAFKAARKIVDGTLTLCEEVDARGRTGGTFIREGENPQRFWRDSVTLKVVRFNRPITTIEYPVIQT
jgi:hypothetical protein